MATLNRRTGWVFPALTGSGDVVADDSLDVSDLSVKEIHEKVESGELDAAEVYEAELAGKARKSVLEAYAPVEDQNDEGTTA